MSDKNSAPDWPKVHDCDRLIDQQCKRRSAEGLATRCCYFISPSCGGTARKQDERQIIMLHLRVPHPKYLLHCRRASCCQCRLFAVYCPRFQPASAGAKIVLMSMPMPASVLPEKVPKAMKCLRRPAAAMKCFRRPAARPCATRVQKTVDKDRKPPAIRKPAAAKEDEPSKFPEKQEILGHAPMRLTNNIMQVASDCSGLCPEGLAAELATPGFGFKIEHVFASESCPKKRRPDTNQHCFLSFLKPSSCAELCVTYLQSQVLHQHRH